MIASPLMIVMLAAAAAWPAAVEGPGIKGKDATVERLLKELDERKEEEKLDVILRLGHLGATEAIPKIRELARKAPSEIVRAIGMMVLGQLGDQEFVADARKGISDKNEIVRGCAAIALGMLGDGVSAPEVRTLLNDRVDSIRQSAAIALGLLGDRESVPKIREFFKSSNDNHLRETFALALGLLGEKDEETAAMNRNLLDAQDPLARTLAALVVAELGKAPDDAARKAIVKSLKPMARWGRHCRSRAIAALRNLGLTDGEIEELAKNTSEDTNAWEDKLRGGLKGITRLRVRTGGLCHRDVAEEKTLFEEKDATAINDFIMKIRVDEPMAGSHCACCGGPTLEFYVNERLAASLTVHHRESIRWEGWSADAPMTGESREWFAAWLEKHREK